MTGIKAPVIDGEKITDDIIKEIFRLPPGVSRLFYRNALIVGSRGSGKTTLFRYLKATHKGLAIHISLAAELGSLTKQIGIGPLACSVPEKIELQIIGKTISLLALVFADRLFAKGVEIPPDILFSCLPNKLHLNKTILTAQWLTETKNVVAKAPPEIFESLPSQASLTNLVTPLGEITEQKHGQLLLLLDRADMIPPSALAPIFEILDQSSSYLALVAMRPGPVTHMTSTTAERVIAGDHYKIIHLGTYPRSHEWINFVKDAVEAQLGTEFQNIQEEAKLLILTIARDSLRTALDLSARTISGERGIGGLIEALEDLKENQLTAAQRTLQRHHPDFRGIVREIHKDALKNYGKITGPLNVKLSYTDTLFEPSVRLGHIVDIGLRASAFHLSEGQFWAPGIRLTEVEIPPIFLWERDKPFWNIQSLTPQRVTRKEQDILHPSKHLPGNPTIFVAYRMDFPESKRFRKEISDYINSYSELSHIVVNDGKVPAGTAWSEVIRLRLKRARLVVGDVEGVRLDVMFELGFAYGLGKTIIPVTKFSEGFNFVPNWLGATQFAHYDDQAGMRQLMTSIVAHLTDPEYSRPIHPPQPIPGLAVWLSKRDWNIDALNQFDTIITREGLKKEVFDIDNGAEHFIRRASSASLLVVSLDGTDADALVHYICGAIIAKPKAGYQRRFDRTILILEKTVKTTKGLTADSLKRCTETVKIISPDSLRYEVECFCKNYRHFFIEPS